MENPIKQKNSKNKAFTPTPILKKLSIFSAYTNFLSLFNSQKRNSVGIGVSLRCKRGFTLIEALVAISILMIAITSPMTLAQKGLSTATQSKDQMIAAFLAQDAVEAVKNIRDQIAVSQTTGDWLTGNGNEFLKPCVCDPTNDFCNFDSPAPNYPRYCQIDTTTSLWGSNSIKIGAVVSPVLNISYKVENSIKSFLKYDYNPQNLSNCIGVNNGECSEASPFKRYINIIKDPTGTNPNEAVVNVRVFWSSPLGIQKVDIQDYIYNYSENL